MSKLRVKPHPNPVVHIPRFQKWGVQQYYLVQKLSGLGIEPMVETDSYILNAWYYYTDLDGWAKVLPDLVLNSNLYKPDIFDCDGYALKAQIECAVRFGLNSMRMCIDKDYGHAYDLFPYGSDKGIEGVMLFEPNDGYEWAGNAFEIGENDYIPGGVFLVGRR